MARQTFKVTENTRVEIRNCAERVTVMGWDEPTIVVDGDARQEGDIIIVEKITRVAIRLPRALAVQIRECHADVRIEGMTGPVELDTLDGDVILRELAHVTVRALDGALVAKQVNTLTGAGTWDGDVALRGIEQLDVNEISGDASISNLGSAQIKMLGGDLVVRGVHGALTLGDVDGDVSVRDVTGALTIARVGDDFVASELRGMLDAPDIEGDAAITFAQVAAMKLRADGDIAIRLPEGANAEIELDALRGDLLVSGVVKVSEQDDSHFSGMLGTGGVKLQAESTRGDVALNAGGQDRVRIEARAEWGGEDWGAFGRRIAEEVRENVQRSLGNVRVEAHIARHREHRRPHRHMREHARTPEQAPTPANQPASSAPAEGSPERKALLDAIARGELSVDDAIRKLRGE